MFYVRYTLGFNLIDRNLTMTMDIVRQSDNFTVRLDNGQARTAFGI